MLIDGSYHDPYLPGNGLRQLPPPGSGPTLSKTAPSILHRGLIILFNFVSYFFHIFTKEGTRQLLESSSFTVVVNACGATLTKRSVSVEANWQEFAVVALTWAKWDKPGSPYLALHCSILVNVCLVAPADFFWAEQRIVIVSLFQTIGKGDIDLS